MATGKGISFIESVKKDDEWITQSEFTKQMEGVLDEISDGKVNYLDFIKPLHEKMGFKELNSGETKPPSEAQLNFAKSIASDLKIALPDGIEADWNICSDFINKNKDKAIRPPSDKQIKLAQDLAKAKKLELPKGYDTDLKICKTFIEKALKRK